MSSTCSPDRSAPRLTRRLRPAVDWRIRAVDRPLDRWTTAATIDRIHGATIMTLSFRRILATTGAAILLSVAAIGVVRAIAPASPTSPSPAVVSDGGAGGTAVGVPPAAAIATVDDPVAAELDALLAADQTAAAPSTSAGVIARGRIRRLAASRHLVHATVVVNLAKGGLTTIQLDHGTISAVGASTLTISEAGGGSVTVDLGPKTRVRRNAAKASIADLKTADEVFVMSKAESGGTTAYLVVVPKP
jgi:hypothetical protein